MNAHSSIMPGIIIPFVLMQCYKVMLQKHCSNVIFLAGMTAQHRYNFCNVRGTDNHEDFSVCNEVNILKMM